MCHKKEFEYILATLSPLRGHITASNQWSRTGSHGHRPAKHWSLAKHTRGATALETQAGLMLHFFSGIRVRMARQQQYALTKADSTPIHLCFKRFQHRGPNLNRTSTSVCTYVCVCVCMCRCIYVYIHTHYMGVYIYMYTYTYVCVYMYMCHLELSIYTCVRLCVCVQIYIYTKEGERARERERETESERERERQRARERERERQKREREREVRVRVRDGREREREREGESCRHSRAIPVQALALQTALPGSFMWHLGSQVRKIKLATA